MKRSFCLFTYITLLAIGTFLSGCNKDAPVAKIIEINKKIVLTDWPDSIYIADLDSVLALEPIKKKDVNKPSIVFNSQKAPVFNLPSKPGSPKTASKQDSPKNDVKKEKSEKPSTPKEVTGESFANRFTDALGALQSDPSNSKLYRIVEAKDGDDLTKLLRRTYGGGVQTLPRFFILSGLKSVNPGVNLDQLSEGTKVKVPRI